MHHDEFFAPLHAAIAFRQSFLQAPHDHAFRLLNGFTEELPGLVIDVFAKTAVIHDYSPEGEFERQPEPLQELLLAELPWLKAIVLKKRVTGIPAERNGTLIFGVKPDDRIVEHGVTYAVQLLMNRDNSFYHDTRNLRQWLLEHMQGRRVLNTFAYTGSLGVAAVAGGASEVIQTDLSGKFLDVARRSYHMNQMPFSRKNFIPGDFFPVIGRLKREARNFDCVILDPPFFSQTEKGRVDLAEAPTALINKVRPLIADDGYLIVVNNSLYLPGVDFLAAIDSLCTGGYLLREEIIAIPPDFVGARPGYLDSYQSNPAPFNHPTKIVILRVKRK